MTRQEPLIQRLIVPAISAHAGNAVTPGELVVEPPTLRCLGFEWDVRGDDEGVCPAADSADALHAGLGQPPHVPARVRGD